MDKPYIRKFEEIAGFTVWIVDGRHIRDNIDVEFTNYGQHLRFKFIPEKEFWIDEEHGGEGEEKYFIEEMLVENRLMADGMKYEQAVEKAERVERKERNKHERVIRGIRKINKEVMDSKIHKELLKKYSKKINVWIVNGRIVRDLFYIDFTEGGHDKVYDFVPDNEIWIDDDLNLRERKFVLLHEIHERNLMSHGRDYASAHKSSSEIEHYCRKNPDELDKRLNEEIKKV